MSIINQHQSANVKELEIESCTQRRGGMHRFHPASHTCTAAAALSGPPSTCSTTPPSDFPGPSCKPRLAPPCRGCAPSCWAWRGSPGRGTATALAPRRRRHCHRRRQPRWMQRRAPPAQVPAVEREVKASRDRGQRMVNALWGCTWFRPLVCIHA